MQSGRCFYLVSVLCRPHSTSQAESFSYSVWVESLIKFQFQFGLGFKKLISPSCLWSDELSNMFFIITGEYHNKST